MVYLVVLRTSARRPLGFPDVAVGETGEVWAVR